MAAECDESCLDLSEFDTTAVTKLQAVCRGWLVRKELKGAQTEFLQVVSELDGPSVDVEWTEASLPRPIVTKSSKKPKSIRVKQQGQASASEQTQGENITSSTCVKCGCLSGESARNAVADRSRMCQENTQESSESSATQGLNVIKAQVYKKVQTDLKLCLSDEELAKRVACEDGEASQAKHSLLSEKAVPCLTVEHLQVNFPEGSDSHEKDSTVKRSQGLHVQDGADVGELHELSNNSAVKSTPVPHVGTTDSPTPTNPTITLTPISSSTTATTSSLLGERSVGSVTSPAVDSSTATSEPVSEGGAGSKMRMMDSLHGDQTSIWDSSSSVNQESSRPHGPFHHGLASLDQHLPQDNTAEAAEEMLRSQSTEELLRQRQNAAMELLWVQQAIISRKKYLRLKKQMEAAA